MYKNIFRGTAIGLITKFITIIGSFLIVPLMLNKLGATTYGIWMTISASIGWIGIMDLGISNNLMNYIAGANNDEPVIKKYISLAYCVQFIFVGFLIISFITTFKFLNWEILLNLRNTNDDILAAIIISFLFFVFSLTSNTIYSIQRGLQRSDIANVWQLISTITYLISLWVVLILSPKLLWISLATFGIPVLIAAINAIWFLRKKKFFSLNLKGSSAKDMLSFITGSASFLFIQLAALLAFQTDAIIIAHCLYFEEVSIYVIVAKVFSIPGAILGVYLQILWPAYSNALSQKNWVWIKNKFYSSIIISTILVLIFIVILFLFKDMFFKLWLNNVIQIPFSLILAFSVWIIVQNCLDCNLAIILNGLHLLKVQLISALLMVLMNLGLSIYLVKNIGIAGVVWGTIISTLVCSTIPLFIYVRALLDNQLKDI